MAFFLQLTTSFLLLVFATINAFAQDLRVSSPNVMRRLKIQNQGKYGTCYAFTGAFLIDYKRFSNNPILETRTSPYSVANAYAKSSGVLRATEGGYVCEGIHASAMAKKLKTYESSSVDESYDQIGLDFHRSMVTNLIINYHPHRPGKKFPSMTREQFKSKKLRDENQEKLFIQFKKNYENFKNLMSFKYFVPQGYHPLAEDAFFILQTTYLSNKWGPLAQSFVSLILDRSVSSLVSVPHLKCTPQRNKASFEKMIKSELENFRPVGIYFCSSIISNSRSTSVAGDASCGQHAVAIIGYKHFGGEGHYLIRNSWGKNFNYDPRWTYDNGDLWVSSSSLLKSTYEIQLVK